LFRFFDGIFCNKGDELWDEHGRMTFATMRIALTSSLTRKHVAVDLGVGMSTLNKWITQHRDTDVVSKEDLSLA